MKKIAFFLVAWLFFNMHVTAQSGFNPPPTPAHPVTEVVHGMTLTDNYRWLENKTNPETVDWTKKQHDYTVGYIRTHHPEINGLKEEFTAYLDRDYQSAPFLKGTYQFYYARKKGENQNKLFIRENGKDRVLFDPLTIDPSGKTSITGLAFSRDVTKFAVGVQSKGNEISDYRVYDLKKGKQIGPVLYGIWGFSFAKDDAYAYISIRTREIIDKQLPIKTYLHKIGGGHESDLFLNAPDDAKDFASVYDDEDGPVTWYTNGDFYSNTLRMKTTGSSAEPKTIWSSKEFESNPSIHKNKIYFLTNDQAPNYKIMVADLANPDYKSWTVFYPEKETVLNQFVLTDKYVIITDKKDILSRVFAYDYTGKMIKEVALPEIGNVASMSYHKESGQVYVTLTTFTAPTKVYRLDPADLSWYLFYEEASPIDTRDIEAKIIFYPSKDGTKVPMFIIAKKGLKLNGNNPTLLYGYGGFQIGITPSFVGSNASFIKRGGVYCIAGLRGGNEYGEKWHLDGMLTNKQNVFDDYIAAAEYLVRENYTRPEKLAADGRSNGGLLMGAVLTQRPDLFKAAICGVPLLDMLRYHKFLIARYWIPEYGDPDKKEDFFNIIRYSPYHNIKYGYNLPATFVYAGENDTRVDPLHAKKFVAALQNNPGQQNPILLFMDFDSGHGSGASVEKQVENLEIRWRFIMNELGMNNTLKQDPALNRSN